MSRRSLLIVLFVSLAFNLFLAGTLVGAGALGHRFRAPPPMQTMARRPGGPMAAAALSLPPERREAWREAWRDQSRQVRPQMREARTVRREAFLKLGREPLDPAAVQADLQRSLAIEQAARAQVDQRIVGFAATLPPADRARFGEALSQPRGRPEGSGGRHPGQRQGGLPDR